MYCVKQLISIKYMLQAWIKCSIIGYGTDKEKIKILHNYIADLNDIKEIFVSDHDLHEFKNSDEPILVFIISFMKKQNTLQVFLWIIYFDISNQNQID